MLDLDTVYKSVVTVGIVVIAVSKFFQGVDSTFNIFKKHSIKDAMHKELEDCKKELHDELNDCKEKLDFHARLLHDDNEHFKRVDDDISNLKNDYISMQKKSDKQFTIMVKTMLALVSYSLDNSDVDTLKDAQKELTDFLAEN